MASQGGTSRLAQMKMRFQQKQLEEREQRRVEMTSTTKLTLDDKTNLNSSFGRGKVRQMFDERRRGTGIDKSYPLKPISTSTIINSSTTTRLSSGGKPPISTTIIKNNRTTTLRNQSPIERLNTKIDPNHNNYISEDDIKLECSPGDDEFIIKKYLKDSDNMNNNPSNNIDKETFLDNFNSSSDFEIMATKLPNVGKLNLVHKNINNDASINSNTSKSLTSRIQLKPVVTKKSFPSSPTKQFSSIGGTSGKSLSPTKPQKPLKSNDKIQQFDKKMPNSTENLIRDALENSSATTCKICFRNFNADRLAKHEEICAKAANSKRKTFDAAKHRISGTDAESFSRVKLRSRPTSQNGTAKVSSSMLSPNTKKPSNWRKKHEDFIEAIRSAKEVQKHLSRGGKLSDLPPPKPSENPDYVQCPHCQRRFNETAANRHIPKCATMIHNKTKTKPKATIKKKA